MKRSVLVAVMLLVPLVARGADPAPKPAEQLQGTWLPEQAQWGDRSWLNRAWKSVVTVKGETFSLSNLMGSISELTGTLVFDPVKPGQVDFKVAGLDLSEVMPGTKLPAGVIQAIYKLDGGRLTLSFQPTYEGKRPTTFAASKEQFLLTLVRAPKDFKELPKEITISVVNADGKPVAGATVCDYMEYMDYEGRTEPLKWKYRGEATSGTDGTVVLKTEKVRPSAIIVRGPANDTMALLPISPAHIANGTFRAELRPQVHVTGKIVCEELAKAGQSVGWTGELLQLGGVPIAYHATKEGKFEFFVPPGKYTLHVIGSNVKNRTIEITVPEKRGEYTLEPVAMETIAFVLLKGKPAPELKDVIAWKGKKTTFADLKGKYVLVEFWGHWCGPCIGSMPTLIALHEKYAEKGVAIVGVHVDTDGEVDTVAKLDEKLAAYKKDEWGGKEIPFPVALVSGKRVGMGDDLHRSGAVAQYGIQAYPTCLLIDPEGKLVGEFEARDLKKASEEIEKLLAKKKE